MSLMDWSCRAPSEVIDSSKELLAVVKNDEDMARNLWTGSCRGRTFSRMGYFSMKEKASTEMAGEK